MQKKNILVVDDAVEVGKLFRFFLEKKYNIREAHDGKEGLEFIRESPPDLLILDINLPKIGGIELYHKISLASGRPSFPVIILTVREELGTLFRDLNVDGFITKPFDMEFVIREVDTVMAKRYGLVQEEAKKKVGPKKILIVENDTSALGRIVVSFLNEGYLVSSAKDGMAAIEKILLDPPDLILIKLGLPDISGDLVCVKLKQMPKTMDIPFVLYTPQQDTLDRAVVNKICQIINARLIETDDPALLLGEAKSALA